MQVSPPTVRGTYGSFVQIATCLGIIVSLLIGAPVKDIDRWSEPFFCSPSRACWSWYVWNPSVLMLLLLLVGGEYVSGLQLSQQLYKLLLWSFVLRALSGYIRCIYFGVTAGSLCYASDLSSQTCVLLLSPILVGLFLVSFSCWRVYLGYNIPRGCKPWDCISCYFSTSWRTVLCDNLSTLWIDKATNFMH